MIASHFIFRFRTGGLHWTSFATPFAALHGCGILLLMLAVSGCRPTEKPAVTTRPKALVAPSSVPRAYLGIDENSLPKEENAKLNWFVDGTVSSGVQFRYRNGVEGKQFTILESVGGGVAMFDFDLDGDLDLLFPGGGEYLGPPFRIRSGVDRGTAYRTIQE